jgi:hypothetical protein
VRLASEVPGPRPTQFFCFDTLGVGTAGCEARSLVGGRGERAHMEGISAEAWETLRELVYADPRLTQVRDPQHGMTVRRVHGLSGALGGGRSVGQKMMPTVRRGVGGEGESWGAGGVTPRDVGRHAVRPP